MRLTARTARGLAGCPSRMALSTSPVRRRRLVAAWRESVQGLSVEFEM